MNSKPVKAGGGRESAARAGGDYFRNYDDAAVTERLAEARDRAREIMHEFNIPISHICEMANAAEQRITDTALRAEFLRTLIELHEFGREARRRSVGVPEKTTAPGSGGVSGPDTPETALFAPTAGASDKVSEGASRDFFASLDSPGPSKDTKYRPDDS